MAKRTDLRPVVTLRSTAGTGYSYVTTKNRRSRPDRLVLRKFDPVAGEHVDFREPADASRPRGRTAYAVRQTTTHPAGTPGADAGATRRLLGQPR